MKRQKMKKISKDLKITKKRVENEMNLQRTDLKFKISRKRLEIEKSQKRLETSSYFSIKKSQRTKKNIQVMRKKAVQTNLRQQKRKQKLRFSNLLKRLLI